MAICKTDTKHERQKKLHSSTKTPDFLVLGLYNHSLLTAFRKHRYLIRVHEVQLESPAQKETKNSSCIKRSPF
jgi:hypothetical protein